MYNLVRLFHLLPLQWKGKGQGMRITLQAPKAENSLSVHTVISKSGVFIEILFLLVTVFEEEK